MSCSKSTAAEGEENIKLDPTNVLQSVRDIEPEHFLLKVESFSILSELEMERYESDEFEAGGHQWRLILYPKGDKKRKGSKHISLYLSISNTHNLPDGWEVKAQFTIFVYNFISEKYQAFQVLGNASVTTFNWLKVESGFAQLLPLEFFKENSNGYLIDDACVFGAEVHVISSVAKRQCLSVMKNMQDSLFTWKVDGFSTIKKEYILSQKFKIGEFQWTLQLYPKGDQSGKGKTLSLFLHAAHEELTKLPVNWKVFVEFKLSAKNQVTGRNHSEVEGNAWFTEDNSAWGFDSFFLLSDLYDTGCFPKGFLVNDTLILEAEFISMAMTKNFI